MSFTPSPHLTSTFVSEPAVFQHSCERVESVIPLMLTESHVPQALGVRQKIFSVWVSHFKSLLSAEVI